MQAQQKFVFEIVFTLFKKFSTIAVFKVLSYDNALCCLAFFFFLSVQFSRCKLRGVPSKLNNARMKRSDLGMLHKDFVLVRSP